MYLLRWFPVCPFSSFHVQSYWCPRVSISQSRSVPIWLVAHVPRLRMECYLVLVLLVVRMSTLQIFRLSISLIHCARFACLPCVRFLGHPCVCFAGRHVSVLVAPVSVSQILLPCILVHSASLLGPRVFAWLVLRVPVLPILSPRLACPHRFNVAALPCVCFGRPAS